MNRSPITEYRHSRLKVSVHQKVARVVPFRPVAGRMRQKEENQSERKTIRFSDPSAVDKSLPEVTLSQSTTRIGERAFEVCSALERIMLPESVEWIGDYVFGGCGSLERVSMGSRLKKIEDRAFLLCRRLNTIVCRAETPPGLGREAFLQAGEAASSKSCRVPRGSVEAYRDDAGWQFLENVMGFGFMPIAAE